MTEHLTVTNTSKTPLAFKVKTTAPKLYCVRPNSGVVQPGSSLQVSIILQGLAQNLPSDYKCKDKFLLVSLPAPNFTDSAKVTEAWSSLEAQHKDSLVSTKLKVNYVVTDQDEQVQENGHADVAPAAVAASSADNSYANHESAHATPSKPQARERESKPPAPAPVHQSPSHAPAERDIPATPAQHYREHEQSQQRSPPPPQQYNYSPQHLPPSPPQQQHYAPAPPSYGHGPVHNAVSLELAIILALIAFMVGYVLSNKLN